MGSIINVSCIIQERSAILSLFDVGSFDRNDGQNR